MNRFTLIELLVSVAIIGILMSILLPSLSQAREATKMAVCKSNQHQFYMAAVAYADEADSYLPIVRNKTVAFMFDTDTDGMDFYNGFVRAYGIDNKVLECPSSPLQMKHQGSPTDRVWSNYNIFTGVETWSNSYGNVTSESPLNVSSSENKWMMITDRTYVDKFDSEDNWRNHGEFKKGNNQTAMDGSTKFYSENSLKFYHSHWTARREYYFYQDTAVNAKKYVSTN